MIKVDLKYENIIIITGHALFDDYGKDLIYLSVISIVMTKINDILSIEEYSIDYKHKLGKVVILKKKNNDIVNILINNKILLLEILKKIIGKILKL